MQMSRTEEELPRLRNELRASKEAEEIAAKQLPLSIDLRARMEAAEATAAKQLALSNELLASKEAAEALGNELRASKEAEVTAAKQLRARMEAAEATAAATQLALSNELRASKEAEAMAAEQLALSTAAVTDLRTRMAAAEATATKQLALLEVWLPACALDRAWLASHVVCPMSWVACVLRLAYAARCVSIVRGRPFASAHVRRSR